MDNAAVLIRPALLEELDQVCTFWQNLDTVAKIHPFGGDGDDKAERARTLAQHSITAEDAICLVVELQGQLVGTLSAYLYDKPAVALPKVAVLYSLWIEPEHRRTGCAHLLVQEAQRQLTALGAQSLQVAWEHNQQAAQAFWLQEGFAAYEVIASKSLV